MTLLKTELDAAVGDDTVAVLRLNVADKTLALFGIGNRFIGNLYKEVGLTPHPLVRDMKEFQEVLSEEAIPIWMRTILSSSLLMEHGNRRKIKRLFNGLIARYGNRYPQ